MRSLRCLSDTRLEHDLQALLWSIVNVFHRRIDRIERELDSNETAQRASQRTQDGSEVRSVELERLVAEGLTLIERRNSFEFLRDAAAELFSVHTGQVWRPRAGSVVNHTTLTAAMIDSREFINARRRADAQVLLPKGKRIAFAGGIECNDHHRIWAVLDKVHAKHSDMVLLHGGTPRGAEKIAACWADHRKVPQVVFKPDWTGHRKAAPFKRNDQLLQALPIGVIVFPGSGVTDNLADKAKVLGIPLFRLPPQRRRVSAASFLDHDHNGLSICVLYSRGTIRLTRAVFDACDRAPFVFIALYACGHRRSSVGTRARSSEIE